MKRYLVPSLAATALILVVLVSAGGRLLATPSIQTKFVATYPTTMDTKLDSCVTCHMPVTKDFLNGYGLALRDAKLVFQTIEEQDSDGDGHANKKEIDKLHPPGSHAWYPEYYIFNNPKGKVAFNHEAHVAEESYLSRGSCQTCHGPDKFPRMFDDSKSVRTTAHRLCWRCHKKSGSENAPKNCAGCHEMAAAKEPAKTE